VKSGVWSGTGVEVVGRVSYAGWDSVTVRDVQPMSSANTRFLRLKVARQ
jgi:hypothetical protein